MGEQLMDSSKAVARRAAQDRGVRVTWTHFDAMSHCFATLPPLNRSRQADVFEKLAKVCRECVEVNKKLEQNVSALAIIFKDAAETLPELDGEVDEKRLLLAGLEKRVRDKIDKVEIPCLLAWPKL